MLKKSLLLSFMFTMTMLPDDAKSEEIKLDFGDKLLNTIEFNPNLQTSALEQLLDSGHLGEKGTWHIYITTPYHKFALIQTAGGISTITALYPHRPEIPFQHAKAIHEALTKSDLLVAKAYTQLMNLASQDLLGTQKHGFWKCRQEKYSKLNFEEHDMTVCHQLDTKTIMGILEEALLKKSAESKDSK